MKALKIQLPNEKWGPLVTKEPATADIVPNDAFTSGSRNFETDQKGVVTKALGGVRLNNTPFPSGVRDQFESAFSDGTHHLLVMVGGTLKYSTGGSSFTDVTSGYSSISNMEFAEYNDRVYFDNGFDVPQVYDRTTSYGGVTYTAPHTSAAGCAVPGSAPTVADGGAGSIAAGTYRYQTTFLYYGAEESNGGTISATVTIAASHQVNLTAIPVGGYGVTARKLYREISTTPGVFRLIATISDNTTTTYTDNATIGTALVPTDNGIPPIFRYVVNWYDRNFMAGTTNQSYVWYSNAGSPNIVGSTNFIRCDPKDPIVGLVVFNNRVYVFNQGSFGQIVGSTPDTFLYAPISATAGCVDCRSIQTRVVQGSPSLIWLGKRGFYTFNGFAVNYVSDPIRDLIDFNIQQSQATHGFNTQSTQVAFQADTSSPAIDLTSLPGQVTVKNPKKVWNTQTAWEEVGSVPTNLVTRGGTVNALAVPTKFAPTYAQGVLTRAINSSGSLTMATNPDVSSGSPSGATSSHIVDNVGAVTSRVVATPFIPATSGTLTSVRMTVYTATHQDLRVQVWSDGPNGPDSNWVVYQSGIITTNAGAETNLVASPNVAVIAGHKYWIGFFPDNLGGFANVSYVRHMSASTVHANGSQGNATADITDFNTSTLIKELEGDFKVSVTGSWVSPVYDCGAPSSGTMVVNHSGTYPSTFGAATGASTVVEGSTDGVTFTVSDTTANLNGNHTVSVSGKRYWRITINLSSNDNRVAPTIGAVTLTFPTTSTWVSAPIDHTTDITALGALTLSATTPAGTTAVVEIATSPDNATYSAYGSIGAATAQRYSKVRLTLTADTGDATSPTATSITLTWATTSTIVSTTIDCGATISAWDAFQQTSAANGGTLLFELKSATTLGGLPGASYSAVTNGVVPGITVQEFAQWRATLSATADSVPTVANITVNWYNGAGSSTRVASIFFDKNYYLSAAQTGQSVNNIVLKYDYEGNWRFRDGISVTTFSLFNSLPYYGTSDGYVVQFATGNVDPGGNITFDIRTKAFDFTDQTKRKVLRKVFITGVGTGATMTPYFSLDSGVTWKNLIGSDGAASYTTVNDGKVYTKRFVPDGSQEINGQTIQIRVVSNDSNAVELHEITIHAMLREGDII